MEEWMYAERSNSHRDFAEQRGANDRRDDGLRNEARRSATRRTTSAAVADERRGRSERRAIDRRNNSDRREPMERRASIVT
jgi:hypothetical protein